MTIQYREVEILGRISLGRNQAQMFHEEFLKIHESGRVVDPETIVTEAADPDNPMHRYFEWDDSVAGHRYRMTQARNYVKQVQVRIEFVSTADHAVKSESAKTQRTEHTQTSEPKPTVVTISAWNHTKDTDPSYRTTAWKRGAYTPYTDSLADEDAGDAVVSRAWKELKGWYDRYKQKSLAYGHQMTHFQQVMLDIEQLEATFAKQSESVAVLEH